MKKSLKMLTATFGVAGLVVLAGCGGAADTVDVLGDAAGDAVKKAGEEVMEAGKDAATGTTDAVDAATKEAMEAGDAAMQKTEEAMMKDGADHDGDAMMKDGEAMKEEGVVDADGAMMEDGDKMDGDAGTTNLDVSYASPAGPHTMAMSITLTDGVITAGTATPESGVTNKAVVKWQGAFAEGFGAAVVGKSIADIAGLDAIGGASLTMGGFQEAVATL